VNGQSLNNDNNQNNSQTLGDSVSLGTALNNNLGQTETLFTQPISTINLNQPVSNENNVSASGNIVAQPSNIEPETLNVETPTLEVLPSDNEPILQPIPGTEGTNVNSNGFVEVKKTENIGTVPPPQKKEKKPVNKTLLFILAIVLIAAVAFGVYFVLNKGGSNIIIQPKTVTVNINSPLSTDPNVYATITGTDNKSCVVTTNEVDISKVGQYKFNVTCGNETKEGKIIVVDMNPPTVEVKDVIVLTNGSVEADDFIASCSKDNCIYSFEDQSSLQPFLTTLGEHTVKINVTDASNNVTTVSASLIVVDETTKVILECVSKEETVGTVKRIIKNKFGIDQENNYNGFARKEHVYTFTNKEEYQRISQNKPATNTYDNITGSATYDDQNLRLIIKTDISEDSLMAEFDGTLPSAYIDLRLHYEKLNYTLSFIKFE